MKEEPKTTQEKEDTTRGSTKGDRTKQIGYIQSWKMAPSSGEDTPYGRWATTYLQLGHTNWIPQTIRRNRISWKFWRNAIIRDYEGLVITKVMERNPGGGAAYIAAERRAFTQMYGDTGWTALSRVQVQRDGVDDRQKTINNHKGNPFKKDRLR